MDPEPQIPRPRPPLAADQVLVDGDVRRHWIIATGDLDAHAIAPIDVPFVTRRRQEVHQVQGVPLHALLTRVQLRTNTRNKMDRLNFAVLVHSADGYRSLLSWAEIDPEFGACAALLATRYNGRRLDRPTLVVPRDGRASRYVREVCHVQVTRIPTG